MARTLKESFGNIGRVMADEYKEHGKARGISIELVNDVFDFGGKVAQAFRTYAPQAADTARDQGARMADAAREYGSKVAETAKARCHDDDSTPCADDDSTPVDDDSTPGQTSVPATGGDDGGSGDDAAEPTPGAADTEDADADADADSGEEDGEADGFSAQPSISPEDAEEARRVIDGKIDAFLARQEDIQSEIGKLTESGEITKEDQDRVDKLSDESAKLEENINYLRDSKARLDEASGNQEGE